MVVYTFGHLQNTEIKHGSTTYFKNSIKNSFMTSFSEATAFGVSIVYEAVTVVLTFF